MAIITRTRVLPVALLLAATTAIGACGGAAPASAPPAEAVGTSAVTDAPAPALSGLLSAPSTVRAEPSASAPVVVSLGAKTPMGSPTSVLVLDERDGWLQVSLPTRPNGSTGWIARDAVELRSTDVAITVDRASHHLTVTRDGEVELEAPVADGTSQNPTPAGSFYVTDVIQTEDPAGAYGPIAFGLSGHSETLESFAGGDGQLGLHGTNDPGTIGSSVSHGCVRVTNDVVTKLAAFVALGTPVTVV